MTLYSCRVWGDMGFYVTQMHLRLPRAQENNMKHVVQPRSCHARLLSCMALRHSDWLPVLRRKSLPRSITRAVGRCLEYMEPDRRARWPLRGSPPSHGEIQKRGEQTPVQWGSPASPAAATPTFSARGLLLSTPRRTFPGARACSLREITAGRWRVRGKERWHAPLEYRFTKNFWIKSVTDKRLCEYYWFQAYSFSHINFLPATQKWI